MHQAGTKFAGAVAFLGLLLVWVVPDPAPAIPYVTTLTWVAILSAVLASAAKLLMARYWHRPPTPPWPPDPPAAPVPAFPPRRPSGDAAGAHPDVPAG